MIFSIYLCMEKIIFAYLSQNYFIKESQVGNDGIYKIEHAQRVTTPTNGEALIKELHEIFSLDEDQIFIAINDWCLEQKPTTNLLFFWKTNSEIVHSPHTSFQKKYLGGFDPASKLLKSNFKMSLLQQYVHNYQYR
jgi:hypothetical protein